MTGILKSTYCGGPLELLLVTGLRLSVCLASLLLQRMDRVQRKGVSECCTTLSESYGIDFVDVWCFPTNEIQCINCSTLFQHRYFVVLVPHVWRIVRYTLKVHSITMFVPSNMQFNHDRKSISSKKNLITANEIVNIFSYR